LRVFSFGLGPIAAGTRLTLTLGKWSGSEEVVDLDFLDLDLDFEAGGGMLGERGTEADIEAE
jgi:hypothetical protein